MMVYPSTLINLDNNQISDLVMAVRKAAANNTDFIYDAPMVNGHPQCQYFNKEGEPSCIVGYGLSALGDTQDDLGSIKNRQDVTAVLKQTQENSEAIIWLKNVQIMQDDGTPWGRAVETADE